jgi:triacylglycerol lipase
VAPAPSTGATLPTVTVIARSLAALLSLLLASSASAGPAAASAETVVLLHGLFRTERSMRPLAERLEEAGYRTHSLGYPSTELAPDALVEFVAREIERCCEDAPRLHLVAHSLGSLLVRGYVMRHRPSALGRVVMVAPPNHGSEWVDHLASAFWFRWLLGPTAVELGTGPLSFASRLPPADYEVGIIAGTRSWRPGAARVLGGPSDGTVSVQSTRLDGMADFIEVAESHTFILRSDVVAEQVRAFLAEGRFRPAPGGDVP